MANVNVANPVKEHLRNFGLVDREAVRRAVLVLADDATREASKSDLEHEEDGEKVWLFRSEGVALGFVEGPDQDVTIVHAAMISRFGFHGA